MRHPRRQVDSDIYALSPPGVAILTHPQLATLRLRAGALDYATYTDRVSRG